MKRGASSTTRTGPGTRDRERRPSQETKLEEDREGSPPRRTAVRPRRRSSSWHTFRLFVRSAGIVANKVRAPVCNDGQCNIHTLKTISGPAVCDGRECVMPGKTRIARRTPASQTVFPSSLSGVRDGGIKMSWPRVAHLPVDCNPPVRHAPTRGRESEWKSEAESPAPHKAASRFGLRNATCTGLSRAAGTDPCLVSGCICASCAGMYV